MLDLNDWDDDEFQAFETAAGLYGLGAQPPVKQPDVFRVMDPPYVSWAIRATAVGGAAISLRWLHVAPEMFVYAVAVPALVFLLWCLLMNKVSSPDSDAQRRVKKGNRGGGAARQKKRAKKRR